MRGRPETIIRPRVRILLKNTIEARRRRFNVHFVVGEERNLGQRLIHKLSVFF